MTSFFSANTRQHEQGEAHELEARDRRVGERASAAHLLDDEEHQLTAVEDRDRQDVEDRQVHADEGEEGEEPPPALARGPRGEVGDREGAPTFFEKEIRLPKKPPIRRNMFRTSATVFVAPMPTASPKPDTETRSLGASSVNIPARAFSSKMAFGVTESSRGLAASPPYDHGAEPRLFAAATRSPGPSRTRVPIWSSTSRPGCPPRRGLFPREVPVAQADHEALGSLAGNATPSKNAATCGRGGGHREIEGRRVAAPHGEGRERRAPQQARAAPRGRAVGRPDLVPRAQARALGGAPRADGIHDEGRARRDAEAPRGRPGRGDACLLEGDLAAGDRVGTAAVGEVEEDRGRPAGERDVDPLLRPVATDRGMAVDPDALGGADDHLRAHAPSTSACGRDLARFCSSLCRARDAACLGPVHATDVGGLPVDW
jgi:hypothetical protein